MESFEYSIFQPQDSKFKEIRNESSNIKNKLMDKPCAYSLIIPAYNEENRIGPFLEHVKSNLTPAWEVIIVCDGNDRTPEIARAVDESFKVLEFSTRLGKGGAIKEGFKLSKGDVLGYVDADGAISFDDINKVYHAVSPENPVVVGSRWVKGSNIETSQRIVRVLLGRVYHYFSFALLGLRTKDTQCGIKAFDSSSMGKILDAVTISNLSFDTAVLYHCKKNRLNIAEMPITWKDVSGSTVKPFKTALVMFLSLIGIRLAHSRKANKVKDIMESIRNIIENA